MLLHGQRDGELSKHVLQSLSCRPALAPLLVLACEREVLAAVRRGASVLWEFGLRGIEGLVILQMFCTGFIGNLTKYLTQIYAILQIFSHHDDSQSSSSMAITSFTAHYKSTLY